MAKKEYVEVKTNIKNNISSYQERLKELNEKELYATKMVKMFQKKLRELRENEQRSKIEIMSVKRLFVGSVELAERCKAEKSIINQNLELAKKIDLNEISKVSFSEGRKIRANLKTLEAIAANARENTMDLASPHNSLGNVFDYVNQEVNLIESYFDYCFGRRENQPVSERLELLEANIDDLLNAQKEYELQAELTGGKILVETNTFKK